jgi:hypothetical protein
VSRERQLTIIRHSLPMPTFTINYFMIRILVVKCIGVTSNKKEGFLYVHT